MRRCPGSWGRGNWWKLVETGGNSGVFPENWEISDMGRPFQVDPHFLPDFRHVSLVILLNVGQIAVMQLTESLMMIRLQTCKTSDINITSTVN